MYFKEKPQFKKSLSHKREPAELTDGLEKKNVTHSLSYFTVD